MKFITTCLGVFLTCLGVFAQKKLDLQTCESLFVKNNLALLAEQYNIDMAKAQIIQAKIWDLPVLSGELNTINPSNSRVFDIGSKGQKAVAVQQLFLLGNKRKLQIEFAKTNQQIAELEFQDLMRNLKLELRKSFISLYFNYNKVNSLNIQIDNIASIITAFSEQVTKNNIALKELVRLQALLLSLKNQRNDILKENIELQNRLGLLTNETDEINPVFEEKSFEKYLKSPIEINESLVGQLLESRPDMLLSKKNIDAKECFTKWQKSLSKPDLTLGLSYDQRGGAFQNQLNLTVAMPLAFWNRNSGNIKIAEHQLNQSMVENRWVSQQIHAEVKMNIQKWNQSKAAFEAISKQTLDDISLVNKGVFENFHKRNISILEFTDFLESYNQVMMQTNESKKNLVVSAEELNCSLNFNLF